MTKLRAIVGGALACAPKSGTSTHAPAAPEQAAERPATATEVAAVAATSPTTTWAEVRAGSAGARALVR